MKYLVILLISFNSFFSTCIYCQDRPITNYIHLTFKIIYKGNSGTSFLIEYKNENYLVTARHLFPRLTYDESVFFEVKSDSFLNKDQGRLLLHSDTTVDITVIKFFPKFPFISAIPIKEPRVIIGDEGYFLGFPLGLSTTDSLSINNGFPVPLVKHAIFSGFGNYKGASRLYLDGNNNKGFSGGPIIFRDGFEKSPKEWHLTGVISGYLPEYSKDSTIWGGDKYVENSGIIVGYGVDYAKEILDNQNKR